MPHIGQPVQYTIDYQAHPLIVAATIVELAAPSGAGAGGVHGRDFVGLVYFQHIGGAYTMRTAYRVPRSEHQAGTKHAIDHWSPLP